MKAGNRPLTHLNKLGRLGLMLIVVFLTSFTVSAHTQAAAPEMTLSGSSSMATTNLIRRQSQPRGARSAVLAAASAAPDAVGQWSPVLNWPLVAVHMARLPTGDVLMWDAWEYGQTPSTRLWSPITQTFVGVPNPYSAMFCAAQTMLSDGRQIVVGGHNGAEIGIKIPSHSTPRAAVGRGLRT